jgi:hypothetical protein
MANIWLLSKQSMKGMDVLGVATDVLYALEQRSSEEPLAEAESKHRLDRGLDLIGRLDSAAKAQISRSGQKDLFLLKVVEDLEMGLGLTPSELAEKLEKGSLELKEGSASSDTIRVLEQLLLIVMKLTSRSVDALSTSLH